jgi:hypothetical protein
MQEHIRSREWWLLVSLQSEPTMLDTWYAALLNVDELSSVDKFAELITVRPADDTPYHDALHMLFIPKTVVPRKEMMQVLHDANYVTVAYDAMKDDQDIFPIGNQDGSLWLLTRLMQGIVRTGTHENN